MRKLIPFVVTLASASLMLSAPAAAQIDEMEPNDSIGQADEIAGAADVLGRINSPPPDPADFFLFSGLAPGEDYEVEMGNTSLGIGHWAPNGTLLDSDAFQGDGAELTVAADGNGEMIISVCGHIAGVLDCGVEADGFGEYLLTVELPEPGASLLAVSALAGVAATRRRSRR